MQGKSKTHTEPGLIANPTVKKRKIESFPWPYRRPWPAVNRTQLSPSPDLWREQPVFADKQPDSITGNATSPKGSDYNKDADQPFWFHFLSQKDDEQKLEAKEPPFCFGQSHHRAVFEKLFVTIKFWDCYLKTFNFRGFLLLQLPTFTRKTLHLLPWRRFFKL